MITTRRTFLRSVSAAGLASVSTLTLAKPDEAILVGQSIDLSGPQKLIGSEVRAGIEAALAEANAAGGIGGRMLNLMSLDDASNPATAARNTKDLLNAGCVSLMGYMGAPQCVAARPIITAAKTPLIGPVTGSPLLRNPTNPYIFNTRASSSDEGTRVGEVLATTGLTRFGILCQDDSFGETSLVALREGFAKVGLKPVLVVNHKTGASNMDVAIQQFINAKVNGIAMGSSAESMITLARRLKAEGYFAILASMSEVGMDNLTALDREAARGIALVQAMPKPGGTDTIAQQYRKAMQIAKRDQLSYGSMEGYVIGRVFLQAARRAGAITPERITSALNSLGAMDLGGLRLNYSANNHMGASFTDTVVIGNQGRVLA